MDDNKSFKEFAYLVKNCKICGSKGYLFPQQKENNLLVPALNKAHRCECIKKAYRYALFQDANIPREYHDLDIDSDFVDSDKESINIKRYVKIVKDNMLEFNEKGKNLFFFGKNGNGKTFVAIEMLKKALESGLTGYYESFRFISDAFQKKGFSYDPKKQFYEKTFEKCQFLVIDDLCSPESIGYIKEESAKILEINILKRRGNKNTIFISKTHNGLDDLETYYSPAVKSLVSNFESKKFEGSDYRKKKTTNEQDKFSLNGEL